MKEIIFCEGSHDSLFLKKMFDELNIKNYKIFDQNTRDKLKNVKDAETKEINRFIEKTSPYDILVKSDRKR